VSEEPPTNKSFPSTYWEQWFPPQTDVTSSFPSFTSLSDNAHWGWDVYWVTERRSESPASWILRTPTRKSLPKIEIDKFHEFPSRWRRGGKMSSGLTGSGSECDVWTLVKVNGGLWEHGVVLEFGTTKGRSVSRDQDEFRLARSHRLQGRLVTKSVLARLDDEGETGVNVVCRLFNLLLSSGGHYNRGKSYSQYNMLIVFFQVLS